MEIVSESTSFKMKKNTEMWTIVNLCVYVGILILCKPFSCYMISMPFCELKESCLLLIGINVLPSQEVFTMENMSVLWLKNGLHFVLNFTAFLPECLFPS